MSSMCVDSARTTVYKLTQPNPDPDMLINLRLQPRTATVRDRLHGLVVRRSDRRVIRQSHNKCPNPESESEPDERR
jgi:hypothetical protein